MTDRELIGQYVEAASQQAFGELVRRHAGWVYGCARRKVRDAHSAEDVTQAVFVLLSQNAGKVAGNERLAPWLFKATHYCSANALKQQARRRKHEREAAMQQQMAAGDAEANWEEIWPILDEAVRKLRAADREAVLLRFYQGMSVSELAGALGTAEDAAKKRVQRAVEKLRGVLAKKGVVPGVGALSVVMAEKLAEAAPAGLVEAATAAAGGGGTRSAGVIAQRAVKMMAWVKVKVAAMVLLIAGLLAGSGAIITHSGRDDVQAAAQPAAQSFATIPSLPDDNRVELLAISGYPNPQQLWWHPDGSIAPHPYQVGPRPTKPSASVSGRHFVFRFAKPLLPRDSHLQFRSSAAVANADCYSLADDQSGQPYIVFALFAEFTQQSKPITMRLGRPSGGWKTVAEYDPATRQTIGNFPAGFTFHDAQDGDNKSAQITLTHPPTELQLRVVATDSGNRQHLAGENGAPAGSSGPTLMAGTTEDHFHIENVPLASIKLFRLETREHQWTEFRNIAFDP